MFKIFIEIFNTNTIFRQTKKNNETKLKRNTQNKKNVEIKNKNTFLKKFI